MMEDRKKSISLRMVQGLMGFEDVRNYHLKEVQGNPLFLWLESQGGPNFLLTKPGIYFDDYKVEIKEDSLGEMANPKGEGIQVYVIVTVPAEPVDMTANLLAPLLVDEGRGLARQVILHDAPYTTRHYLFPSETRRNTG